MGAEVKEHGKDQLLLLVDKFIKYQHMLDLEINSFPLSYSILPPISSPNPPHSKSTSVVALVLQPVWLSKASKIYSFSKLKLGYFRVVGEVGYEKASTQINL